jgi:hypothetical protein
VTLTAVFALEVAGVPKNDTQVFRVVESCVRMHVHVQLVTHFGTILISIDIIPDRDRSTVHLEELNADWIELKLSTIL